MIKLNMLFWNARGMGNPLSTSHLKKLIRKHSIHVCAILESVVQAKQIRKFSFLYGGNSWIENQTGGGNIWLM